MYRVIQPEVIDNNDKPAYMSLFGGNIVISNIGEAQTAAEVIPTRFSFNDMFKDPNSKKVILASAQSGGAIQIINFDNKEWKNEYNKLKLPGKLQEILSNSAIIKQNLKSLKKSFISKRIGSCQFYVRKQKQSRRIYSY